MKINKEILLYSILGAIVGYITCVKFLKYNIIVSIIGVFIGFPISYILLNKIENRKVKD